MLSPGDNKALHCFVREGNLDNDFKLALYSRWHEGLFALGSEVCKTKELYYKVITDPRIKERIEACPLELVKLHHDLAQQTDKWITEVQNRNAEHATAVRRVFQDFARSLDQSGRTGAKIERCFVPYVEEAERKRKSIFESFQKNLVDGLLWEHTTRDSRRVELVQPSVGNSSNHDTTGDNQPAAEPLQKLSWDDYADMKFASNKSAIEEVRPGNTQAEINEEDDQVRSVN
jgi:hypothetical protein